MQSVPRESWRASRAQPHVPRHAVGSPAGTVLPTDFPAGQTPVRPSGAAARATSRAAPDMRVRRCVR